MNAYQSIASGGGILKNAYPQKGPIAQMNQNSPMMKALRMKRDALKRQHG
jgi:hypothetical protein